MQTKNHNYNAAREAGQKFLGRAPKFHHPIIMDVVQESLCVLDEKVDAHVGGKLTTLPAGTTLSITAKGIGPSGRLSVHGSILATGEQVSIPIE